MDPIINGTVHGPALNGTVMTGVGYPVAYNNGSLMVNYIDAPGMSDDGVAFFIHEVGIGPLQKQISRIVSFLPKSLRSRVSKRGEIREGWGGLISKIILPTSGR